MLLNKVIAIGSPPEIINGIARSQNQRGPKKTPVIEAQGPIRVGLAKSI